MERGDQSSPEDYVIIPVRGERWFRPLTGENHAAFKHLDLRADPGLPEDFQYRSRGGFNRSCAGFIDARTRPLNGFRRGPRHLAGYR